jgi:predicted nucleic acid-binding protein
VDAFDADVMIYAAIGQHELGRRVRVLLDDEVTRVGSVLLLPEVLSKPQREQAHEKVAELGVLLARLELRAADLATAELAAGLGASYGLRAADAIHLATAVVAGADRFITNNKSDFPKSILEIDVTYPEDLPE